jgi:hypothetical protein
MTNQKFNAGSSDISFALRNPQLISMNIDSLKYKGSVSLSGIFKRVQTIILETNKEALIGDVTSIQVYGDRIYILDRSKSKGVYVFAKTGKFIQRIGKFGQGPAEYVEPFDFTIDKKNNQIYLLDRPSQKILKYSLSTGAYLSSIKLAVRQYQVYHIQSVGDKLYTDVFCSVKGEPAFLLQEINLSTGDTEKKWLASSNYSKNNTDIEFRTQNVFYDKTQDSPKFLQSYMDTIVSFNKKGEIVPFFALKSKFILTESELSNISENLPNTGNRISSKMIALQESSKFYDFSTFITYKDFIYFSCKQKFYSQQFYSNKKTRETIFCSGVDDDLVYEKNDQHIGLQPRYYTSSDDGVYSVVQPSEMNTFLGLVKTGKLTKNLDKRDQLMKLNADANPVIFVYSN